MAEFTVTVEGREYDVTAPDERTAWKWANVTHAKAMASVDTNRSRVSDMPASLPAGYDQAQAMRARLATTNTDLTLPEKAMMALKKLPFGAPGQRAVDLAAGASTLMRGSANMLIPGAGEEVWPISGATDSGWRTAGTFADPVSLAIGGGVGKVLPYAKVLGGGFLKGFGALAKNLASGGAAGGAIGLLSGNGDFEKTKEGVELGALLNATLPPVVQGAINTAMAPKALGQIFVGSPTKIVRQAADDKLDDLIKALESTKSGIPGINLTVGQASVPVNIPEIAALQKMVAARAPARYGPMGIEGSQEAARLAQVQNIAQTPQAIEDAIAARSATTKPMRNAALDATRAVGVSTDRLIRQIRGVESQPGIRASDVVSKTLAKVKEKINEFTNENGYINAKDLYTIRKEIGNYIQQNADESKNWDKRLAGGLQRDLQRNIDDAIEVAGGKGWKDYLAKYAEMSRPIEQMKAAQTIEQAITAPGTGAERVSSFGTALRKPEIMEVLTPQQRQALSIVEDSMKFDAQYEKLASAGEENLKRRISSPHLPSTGLFSPIISASRGWINDLMKRAENKGLDALIPLMDKPEVLAAMLRQLPSLYKDANVLPWQGFPMIQGGLVFGMLSGRQPP